MTFTHENILILGGMGFIGSNLAIRLVRDGAKVTIVDAMLPQYGGNEANIDPVRDACRIVYADIRDREKIDELVRDAEVIYSLAGQTSHIESMEDPVADMDINCRSQLSILESCRKGNREAVIVYASTRQVYGRPEYVPVDERHPIRPVDVNGINKLAAEMYYTLYSQVHGMKCISLRLTNTYGPRQFIETDTHGFTGMFIRKAMRGETIKVFGTGEQRRDFNYVDDVVEACLLAPGHPELFGGVYNLGSDETFTLNEFVGLLKRHCDFSYETVPFPPEHKIIDIGDYYADYSKFRGMTGWEPAIPLGDGLERTIAYFRSRARA